MKTEKIITGVALAGAVVGTVMTLRNRNRLKSIENELNAKIAAGNGGEEPESNVAGIGMANAGTFPGAGTAVQTEKGYKACPSAGGQLLVWKEGSQKPAGCRGKVFDYDENIHGGGAPSAGRSQRAMSLMM